VDAKIAWPTDKIILDSDLNSSPTNQTAGSWAILSLSYYVNYEIYTCSILNI